MTNHSIGPYHFVEYLGDSVYIGQDDGGNIWLFTYNGIGNPRNEICLEDNTIKNFLSVIRKYGYDND